MTDMKFRLEKTDAVVVSHAGSGAEFTFYIKKDRFGRRSLDGPHAEDDAMSDGKLLQSACTIARSEAMRAGKVDY